MPTNNGNITFKYGTQNAYNGLSSIDENAIYITTDTHRIYIGGADYTDDTQMNNVTKQYIDNIASTVNSRVDNIIVHNNDTEGNSELIDNSELADIRFGTDGTTYISAGTAIRTQIERYSNGERNAVLTSGATAGEKAVFDNLLYIKAYGIDLSGYYVSTVVNSEQSPYRIILKKGDSASDFISFSSGGSQNFCYYKTIDAFVVIGYNWDNHTNDINLNYGNSHIRILDSVHSTDSIVDYLKNKISNSDNTVASINTDVEEICNDLYDYGITGNGTVTAALEGVSVYPYNGKIVVGSVGSTAAHCTVYSVTAGNVYRIKADNYSLSPDSYPAVVFTKTNVTEAPTTLLDASVLYETHSNARNVDFVYHCRQNGYVVIAWRTGRNELKLYSTEKLKQWTELDERISAIESKTDSLSGKTIAILGDSIMALMRSTGSLNNVVSYLGSDGNTYTYDQLTNIDGKLYVAADNSIICTVVNSAQNLIDSQNWDALKNATGAADVINCGLGGGKVTENQIITDYPYSSGDYRTTCLSNEVRMLNRLVQSGRNEPDCILIWIGTNDASNNNPNSIVADNFDEVMALDYNTLADDSLGRTYRQTFYGGLRYSLEMLIRNYPYATIMVFTPVQTNPANQRTYENLTVVGNALKKMANRYSCICVNALTEIGIVDLLEASDGSGFFLADGLHPNAKGKKLFANFTAKKLNTLYFSKG